MRGEAPMDEKITEIMSQLASNETEHKSFRRRLDDHDEELKKQGEILVQMERQSNAMEHMSESIGRVEKKVNSIDDRVAELEKEPGEKWKKIGFEIIKYLVLAAIGAVAGYLISKI